MKFDFAKRMSISFLSLYLVQLLFAVYRCNVPVAHKIVAHTKTQINVYQGVSFVQGCIPILGLFYNLYDHGKVFITEGNHTESFQYDCYSDVDLDKLQVQTKDNTIILEFPNHTIEIIR